MDRKGGWRIPADGGSGHQVETQAAEPEEPLAVVAEGTGPADHAHEEEGGAHAQLEKPET